MPTAHGVFRFLAYKDRITGTDHIAVVAGDLTENAPLVQTAVFADAGQGAEQRVREIIARNLGRQVGQGS